MRPSLRSLLPGVTAFLLLRHAVEWSSRRHALASYTIKPKLGAWVILRTPRLGTLRLVSALVLASPPESAAEWAKLKKLLLRRGVTSLAPAKHRYLFVPEKSFEVAKKLLSRTAVQVRSNNSLERTTGLRPVAAQLMIR
jgi:hypothetical protein